jgi:hypothetical protein
MNNELHNENGGMEGELFWEMHYQNYERVWSRRRAQ